MDTLVVLTCISGIFFGVWPLFMNKSGLPGHISPSVFSTIGLAMVLPMALRGLSKVAFVNANWGMAIGAGISGGLGMIFFSRMLAEAKNDAPRAAMLIALMTVIQVTVAALYKIALTRAITPSQAIGFMTAALTAFLLLR